MYDTLHSIPGVTFPGVPSLHLSTVQVNIVNVVSVSPYEWCSTARPASFSSASCWNLTLKGAAPVQMWRTELHSGLFNTFLFMRNTSKDATKYKQVICKFNNKVVCRQIGVTLKHNNEVTFTYIYFIWKHNSSKASTRYKQVTSKCCSIFPWKNSVEIQLELPNLPNSSF